MNIFILDDSPQKAAQYQCDKHVLKMAVESAQMLSTAHRVLDGVKTKIQSKSGKRMIDYWSLSDERENVLMKPCHVNHPCSIWVRDCEDNYKWLFDHFKSLIKEYTFRYEKHRALEKYLDPLSNFPKNIPFVISQQQSYVIAVGDKTDCVVPGQTIATYRNYYRSKQESFKMVWTKREQPFWF